jgi:hypothetical protein
MEGKDEITYIDYQKIDKLNYPINTPNIKDGINSTRNDAKLNKSSLLNTKDRAHILKLYQSVRILGQSAKETTRCIFMIKFPKTVHHYIIFAFSTHSLEIRDALPSFVLVFPHQRT